jgi:hypothetical protein
MTMTMTMTMTFLKFPTFADENTIHATLTNDTAYTYKNKRQARNVKQLNDMPAQALSVSSSCKVREPKIPQA